MQTPFNKKKAVTLFELLGSLSLYSILSVLVISLFMFVTRSLNMINEYSNSNLASTNSTQSIMNAINKFSPQGVSVSQSIISGTTYTEERSYRELSFTRSVIYEAGTDGSGNAVVNKITPSDSRWTGGTTLTFRIRHDSSDGYATLVIVESGGEYGDNEKVEEVNIAGLRMNDGGTPTDLTKSYITVKGYSSTRGSVDCYCVSFHLSYHNLYRASDTDVLISIYVSV